MGDDNGRGLVGTRDEGGRRWGRHHSVGFVGGKCLAGWHRGEWGRGIVFLAILL